MAGSYFTKNSLNELLIKNNMLYQLFVKLNHQSVSKMIYYSYACHDKLGNISHVISGKIDCTCRLEL